MQAVEEVGSQRFRILVVDDDQAITEFLSFVLGRELHVSVAASVGQALEAIEKDLPDLLITDLHMPGRNGVELLLAVGKQHPDVLRMILSGEAPLERQRLVDEGIAHAELGKPFDAESLCSAVMSCITCARASGDSARSSFRRPPVRTEVRNGEKRRPLYLEHGGWTRGTRRSRLVDTRGVAADDCSLVRRSPMPQRLTMQRFRSMMDALDLRAAFEAFTAVVSELLGSKRL